ncbi:MAG TPA: translocation/assembly module TamB domain-containing protein [Candidatus Krumholzibacteria bacterium]|nr:translocation/assembly module TamB domain-containing protein [Candidatus Krumholzibacteria bacterium]
MSRTRRILLVVAASAGALLVLVVLFGAFVLFTTPGGKLALRIANGRDLPVRAASFDGALVRRFRLYGVALRVEAVEADMDTVTIAWRPRSLRLSRLEFTEIDVAGARVVVHERAESQATAAAVAADTTEGRWKIATERLRVRRATMTAPGGVHLRAVDVTASGEPDGYRADVVAAGDVWRVSNARVFVRVSGTTEGATLDSLDAHALGGNVRGSGFVRWSSALAWNARLQGDSLRAGAIAPAPEEWLGAVSFRLSGSGEIRDDSTRIDVDLASLDGTLRDRPLSARGRASLRGTVIEASDARVTWGSAYATLSGSMAETADVTLDAVIPSLAEILPRASGSGSVKGSITGTPAQIRVNVAATGRGLRAAGRDMPDLDAALDVLLDADNYVPRAADVRRGDIRLAGGTLNVRGRASFPNQGTDAITWDVALDAKDFETSTLTPARWDLRGPVSVRARTSGRLERNDLTGRLELASLSGTLRDRALSGGGTVDVRGREADITNFRLDWGELHLAANGHAGETLDLVLELTAPDLSIVRSDVSGSIVLNGTARGPLRRPAVDATIAADSLRVRGYSVRRLQGDIAFDPEFASPARVDVVALGASAGGAPFDSVRVTLNGPRERHVATVEGKQGAISGALTARGALADTVWTGHIEIPGLRHPRAGVWRTDAPASVRATPSGVALDSLVLVSSGGRLVVRGAWTKGDTANVAVDLDGFPLAILERHFPTGTRVTGTLDGTAAARIDPAGRIFARADLEPGPGRVTYSGKSFAYGGRLIARADASGVVAGVDLALTRGRDSIATIDGDLSIPGFVMGRDSLGAQPIDGTLNLDCADIAPLLFMLAPDLTTNAAGVVTARLKTRGTAGDFRIAGALDLTGSRFDLASGLLLRDVALSLASDGAGQVSIDGNATSGGGRVRLSAATASSGGKFMSGTFSVSGERFQLMNRPEAQVFISPELEVRVADRKLAVTGDVRVPFAHIETTEVPSTAVTPSHDVVFVEDTLATRAPMQVSTKVRVVLGDSVTFSGFGLRTRLDGSLVVEDEVGQPTRGTGEIRLKDGKYRAYGNELTIDPGRFVFGGGPVDNPGLDIRAYRGLTTQNVMAGSGEIVGIKLTGSLRKPQFSVFSNPPMSESETLSYLMLGRPLSSGSSSEQAALANAMMIVGMQQGNQLAGGLGKQFALDDAYIEAGETSREMSFVAGKYLSPKLYVSYATGLFEQTNTFRVRYSLSSRWTVQAENGRYASSDLLYWFERGK